MLAVAAACSYSGWMMLVSSGDKSLLWVGGILCILLVLHMLLVILLERSLLARHVRFSFMLGFSLAIVICLVMLAVNLLDGSELFHWRYAAAWVLISWLGSFAGGLIVTARAQGIWEDNAPPPEAIQETVVELHQAFMNKPQTIPFPKRFFDFFLSLSGVVVSFPVWLLAIFLIWLEDPGALLFVKNSVGRGGINFRQFKLRTMVRGAEESTGPVMTQEGDPRILRTGRFLRKSHLDELPQLINILKGEMSVVGPRPQRTVLVYGYLKEIPEYAERHRVLPGLAGLAQVAGSYFLSPRQKLRLDRLYIQRMSLGFDLRILLAAFMIAFWFRWQNDWDGRLPRWLLHGCS